MGRRHKFKRRGRDDSSAVANAPADSALFSGYSGANQSTRRATIWWPTLETKHELDSYSRHELLRRIRWLYANTGIVRGFINNAADLIGWLTPQANTADPEWNERAEEIFRDRAGTAEAFDVAGKFDFWDAQLMLMRSALKDGDILTVLTESEGGGARVGFYEAHQLASPSDGKETWADGVYSKKGRHLAYGIRDPESDKVAVIGARDSIYFGEFDSPGHHRAVPKLAHAVNHALDITEVDADTKTGIKTSALFGAVIERQGSAPSAGGSAKQGLPAAMGTTTLPDGTPVEVAKVWGGPTISRLNPGETLKILNDGRPHQNQMEYKRSLIREMSCGFGLPMEVIYEIARMTGPGVRFVMDVADRWIKSRQKRLRTWCRRIWVYTIAKEIKAGRLDLPKDKDGNPLKWWAVKFVPQRNLTIDRGRELSGRVDTLERGFDTEENFQQEIHGVDWRGVARQRVLEVKHKMELCAAAKVPFEVAFPNRNVTGPPPAPAGAEPPPKKSGKAQEPAEPDDDEP
jgi:capsid protein